MVCPHCASLATSERPSRTELGYRRCRCRDCKREFSERAGTPFNCLQYLRDVVCLVVLWRFRYKLSQRDLAAMFLDRGIVFMHEAAQEWEMKLAEFLSETLRKRRYGAVGKGWYVDGTSKSEASGDSYRAIDRDGNLVYVRLNDTRDFAAAEAFFRSASMVTGVTPDRITTDRHDAHPRAIRNVFGERVTHRRNR